MVCKVIMKFVKKVEVNFRAKVQAFRAFLAQFSRFDLKFSLEFKVISWILSIFVDDAKLLSGKNLLSSLGIFVCAFVPLLSIFQFESFELKFLAMLELIAALQVIFKFLVIFANLNTFKLLKRRISNDDGHFEAEMSVELFYRKLARAIILPMLGLHGCSIVIIAIAYMYPFQLPFTNDPNSWVNYLFGWFYIMHIGFFYSVFELFFCLVTVFILSKIAVCEFYVKQIGSFEEPHGTAELQSKLIIKCVDLYGKIIDLIDEAKSLFELALLAQLLATMVLVVGSTHLLLKEFSIRNFLAIAGALVPFCFSCFLSGFITSKCEEISDTLYCRNWYEFTDRDDRKKILMLLRMMQRPQGYSAGGFVTLGFKVFADFLKQAYSYLMILRNVM